MSKPKKSKPRAATRGSGKRAQPAREKAPVVIEPSRLDLSRIRHDLRTPINHIIGYCEMLQEDENLPPVFVADLRKIHAGGRQLLALIAEYFDEENFETKRRDVHQLCHDLRTPVNHIIGYSEILQEQAEDLGRKKYLPDLKKIHDAAAAWLALMEEQLLPAGRQEETGAAVSSVPGGQDILVPGISFQSTLPRSATRTRTAQGSLLVVDDDADNRDMLGRRLRHDGYAVTLAVNGVEALRLLRAQPFDLVLLDLIMSGLDGAQVLMKMKTEPALREIPVIMLSALDQEGGIARCIELGAEDYIAKPFSPVFLRARIGACLEKKRLRDKERATHEALQRSQKHLADELTKAAGYVRSLLPAPLTGAVETEWCFQPSDELGGDAFGYHWIDDNHLAIYLLDVCGHGVGAALLSVSVLNALRANSLPGVDFRRPAEVLAALNRSFWMENQNFLYFTLWYGVYRPAERELDFASGGHPPALLITSTNPNAPVITPLATGGPAVGCLENATFKAAVQSVPEGARLMLFSDGIFEIFNPDGSVGTWDLFMKDLGRPDILTLRPEARLRRAQEIRGATALEDDFSLVEVRFC